MKAIFESGEFRNYKINESQLSTKRSETRTFSAGGNFSYKTTVFLSHKHDDLEDLKDLIGFLSSNYSVDVYVDSRDPGMPKETSGETAKRIKDIINKCDKFILLAIDGAIESKWCNWELGYGDAKKYRDKIALFPIKPKGTYDWNYKGNEYMQIYPHIVNYNGTEMYRSGGYITAGYYVGYFDSEGTRIITPLSEWLKK